MTNNFGGLSEFLYFIFFCIGGIVKSYDLLTPKMKIFKNEKPASPQYAMPKPRRVITPPTPKEQPEKNIVQAATPDEKGGTEALLSWSAKQFETVPKTRSWYIGFFVVIALLLAYGLFSDNFLLGIIAILIALMYYLFEKREVQEFNFSITPEGVLAQDRVYEFSSLESFWIFFEPQGRKELSLKSTKNLIPYIHIPLGNADPAEIRDTMMKFLPEIEHKESMADSLTQMM